MGQSTVQICIDEQRERYYKALIMKISEFKKFIAAYETQTGKEVHTLADIKRLLREAISFKNLFDIKTAIITLTRDDLDLLTRILDTSA